MKTKSLFGKISIVALLVLMASCKEYPPFAITEKPFVNTTGLELFTGATTKVTSSPEGVGFSWSSDNPAVATVTSDGTVTAVSPGQAVITVASSNDKTTFNVTVRDYVALDSLVVPVNYMLATVGSKKQLQALLYPSDASDPLEWSSSNTSVASVYQSGLMNVQGLGKAVITVKCGDVEKHINVDVPELMKVDKTNWLVPGYQDSYAPQIGYNTQEAGGEGGPPNGRVIAIFDNNTGTFWHTQWSNGPRWTFPVWAIIDMGEEVEIGKIVTTRRLNVNSGKTITYYLSETLLVADSPLWGDPIGSSMFSSTASNSVTSIEMSKTGIKGRYLKIYCPDSYIGIVAIAEVDVYQFKWE